MPCQWEEDKVGDEQLALTEEMLSTSSENDLQFFFSRRDYSYE